MSRLAELRNKAAAPAAVNAEAPANPGAVPRHLRTGDDLDQTAKQFDDESKARRDKFAAGFAPEFFFTDKERKAGVEKIVVLLDANIKNGVGMPEHSIKTGPNSYETVPCVRDFANCAACTEAEKKNSPVQRASFVVRCSIVDTTPYEYTDGDKKGQTVPFTKKLLKLKSGSRATFQELANMCISTNGTARGMILTLKRDPNDAQSPACGEPVEMPITVDTTSGPKTFMQRYDIMSEDDMLAEFSTPEVKNAKGEVTSPKNACLVPFDYIKLFPEPDPEAVRRKVGGAPVPGSASHVANEWTEKGEAQTQAQPGQATPANTSSIRSRLRQSAAAQTQPAAQQVSQTAQLSEEEEFEQAGAQEIPEGEGKPLEDEIPFGQ